MEISRLFNAQAPIAVSSVIEPSMLPQAVQRVDQQKHTDDAPVRLSLSPAAQNLLSSRSDVSGRAPITESSKQESNPSDDPDQQSRDSADEGSSRNRR